MKKVIRILPYKQGSKSARALAAKLGGKVLKTEKSLYVYSPQHKVINWGNVNCPYPTALNAKLGYAQNKLKFFERVKELGFAEIIPPFWTRASEIPSDVYPIVCRTTLTGHSGAGIVLANDTSGLASSALYVKYIKKQDEYRVHVARTSPWDGKADSVGEVTKVLCTQQKKRRNECKEPNWQIRNHQNGFIYARDNVNPPASVLARARLALLCADLDFGAVDVIYNQHEGTAYVLEVNTAPGLEGQTVLDYAEYFNT